MWFEKVYKEPSTIIINTMKKNIITLRIILDFKKRTAKNFFPYTNQQRILYN